MREGEKSSNTIHMILLSLEKEKKFNNFYLFFIIIIIFGGGCLVQSLCVRAN